MSFFPAALDELVEKFASLPGVGFKSAQRLAFYILSLPEQEAKDFADAIYNARRSVRCCSVCQNLTDKDVCAICGSPARDGKTVCVVQSPKDLAAIERTHEYNGKYHVLHGVISPLNRIGPDDIRIKELVDRVAAGGIEEVIMALNPDTEGETTSKYISRLIKPFGVKVTRLAHGIPAGASLEFVDDATIGQAIDGRQEM